jgi:hypothetical protein
VRIGSGVVLGLAALFAAPKSLAALASGADFLAAQIPARPAAMGGAFGAFDDDATAFLWNPAALGAAAEPMVSATHFVSIADTEFDQASYVQPLRIGPENAGLGLDVQYDTTSNFDQIDANGNDLGAVENYDLLVSAAGGFALGPALRLGAAAKTFDSALAGYKAQGFAVDLGVQSDVTRRLAMGLAFLDLGTQQAYDQVADPLPAACTLAARYRVLDTLEGLSDLSAQAQRPVNSDGSTVLALGGEYWYRSTLAFRAGYQIGVDTGPFSLGAGLKWQGLTFDYAFNTLGDLGMTHRFTLGMELGTLFRRLGWTVDPIRKDRPKTDDTPRVAAP